VTSDAELSPTADREISPRHVVVRAVPAPQRWSRRRGVVSAFALFAVAGFAAAYIGPLSASMMPSATAAEVAPVSLYASTIDDAQAFIAASGGEISLGREGIVYSVYVAPKPTPTPTPTETGSSASSGGAAWAPPFVTPDPGTAQAIAYSMVQANGWGADEFACLVALWNKESGWRVNAYNKGSGAYGIPQALPGNKMGSVGADWETNPATQIAWGLGYIGGRYGTPCGAWGHSQAKGWY
jgi:hypothetical protein